MILQKELQKYGLVAGRSIDSSSVHIYRDDKLVLTLPATQLSILKTPQETLDYIIENAPRPTINPRLDQ